MASSRMSETNEARKPSLIALLRPYWGLVFLLALLIVAGSGLGLIVPQLVAHAIDGYTQHTLSIEPTILRFTLVALGIFIVLNIQSIVQTYASEIVARDLRTKVANAISVQEYAAIEALTPSKLLTNLTSDVDAIKTFISQAIASLISSAFLIVGASALLLWLDWRLAIAVLAILPFIAGTFYVVLGRVRKLFRQVQEAVDRLNKVISESILGAALVRLLNSRVLEHNKFDRANETARSVSMQILNLFAAMIPVITFLTNIATLIILTLGGHFVITGGMTLGDFTAFNSYLAILIFPIIIIGFMSNVIAQAQASYVRIAEVLDSPVRPDSGTKVAPLSGALKVEGLSLEYGENHVLKDISLAIKPHTKNAIIGPTAAGKSQLLYLITGLLVPTSGTISYDGVPLPEYSKEGLHAQVGFVFQDSVLFNLTLRENIAFSNLVDDEHLAKAIDTAELHDFIGTLPNGLDTVVSERGTSLSGGQKQRVMLARALALNPKILLLDDFTARVDSSTEAKILSNLMNNYPDITLVSITQKIAPVEEYDQIIVLMEGEVLGVGTHQELIRSTPEYVQIFDSQKSTERYETA